MLMSRGLHKRTLLKCPAAIRHIIYVTRCQVHAFRRRNTRQPLSVNANVRCMCLTKYFCWLLATVNYL